METVRTWEQTIEKVNANPGFAPLLAEHRNNAQDMVARGRLSNQRCSFEAKF